MSPRARSIAARATGVDQISARRPNRRSLLAHDARAAGNFFNRLALHAQRNEKGAYLCIGCLTAHDLFHDLARPFATEVCTRHQ